MPPMLKRLFNIAIPIFIAQSSVALMGMFAIKMVGQIDVTDVAAAGLGIAIWFPIALFGLGLLLSISPTIAYLHGSNQLDRIAHQYRQAIWIALFLSVVICLLLFNSQIIFQYIPDIEPELMQKSVSFLRAISFGVPGFFLFSTLRYLNDGLSKTKITMFITIAGLGLNLILNYILIYGRLGFPQLGVIGAGTTIAIVNWSMFFMALWYCSKSRYHRQLHILDKFFEMPDPKTLKNLIYMGFPISLAMCSESAMFDLVILFIAPLGSNVISGHQVTLTISALVFTIPLSIAMATTVMVGQQLGAKSFKGTKQVIKTNLSFGLCLSIISATAIITFNHELANYFLPTSPKAASIAATLMLYMGGYQCFDALQTIIVGILRGFKDTKIILYVNLFCYWLIGVGSGYLLGMTDIIVNRMGAAGFWLGFIIGLFCATVCLGIRLYYIQKMSRTKLFKRLDAIE